MNWKPFNKIDELPTQTNIIVWLNKTNVWLEASRTMQNKLLCSYFGEDVDLTQEDISYYFIPSPPIEISATAVDELNSPCKNKPNYK
ncbi:hypothetical protein NBRC116600_06600 [Thalassotalea sp. SU-HH00458]